MKDEKQSNERHSSVMETYLSDSSIVVRALARRHFDDTPSHRLSVTISHEKVTSELRNMEYMRKSFRSLLTAAWPFESPLDSQKQQRLR